jgi:hypothetical protein
MAQRPCVVTWFAVAIGCEIRETNATDAVTLVTCFLEERPRSCRPAIRRVVKPEPALERAPSENVMAARGDIERERSLLVRSDARSDHVVHPELDTCVLIALPA